MKNDYLVSAIDSPVNIVLMLDNLVYDWLITKAILD